MTIADDLNMSEEDLKAYVGWNTCTKHQVIIAHLIGIRGQREAKEILADALGMDHPGATLNGLCLLAADRLKQQEE